MLVAAIRQIKCNILVLFDLKLTVPNYFNVSDVTLELPREIMDMFHVLTVTSIWRVVLELRQPVLPRYFILPQDCATRSTATISTLSQLPAVKRSVDGQREWVPMEAEQSEIVWKTFNL